MTPFPPNIFAPGDEAAKWFGLAVVVLATLGLLFVIEMQERLYRRYWSRRLARALDRQRKGADALAGVLMDAYPELSTARPQNLASARGTAAGATGDPSAAAQRAGVGAGTDATELAEGDVPAVDEAGVPAGARSSDERVGGECPSGAAVLEAPRLRSRRQRVRLLAVQALRDRGAGGTARPVTVRAGDIAILLLFVAFALLVVTSHQ